MNERYPSYLRMAPESYQLIFEQSAWQLFISRYWPTVEHTYKENELKFDPLGIHGAGHALRTTMAGHLLLHFYGAYYEVSYPQSIALLVIALHDAGRLENGSDIWETQSCQLCKKIMKTVVPKEETIYIDACADIIKPISQNPPGLSKLLHDADALEYSRFISKKAFEIERLYIYELAPRWSLQPVSDILDYLIKLQEWEIISRILGKK